MTFPPLDDDQLAREALGVYLPDWSKRGCDHEGCTAPVVYRDDHHALCDDHYTDALERQGGAHDGCDHH